MTTRTAALLLSLLLGCAQGHRQPTPPPRAARVAAKAVALPPAQGQRHPASVVSIRDGDTFTATVAFHDPVLGASGDVLRKVRILGINAPELSKPGGKESRAALVKLLSGGPVEVEPVGDDAFGRLLATVWAGGVNVGDEMVRQGQAAVFGK